MIELTQANITTALGYGWWPLMRVTGFFLMAPILGDRTYPMRARLLMAIICACLIMPFQVGNVPFNPFSIESALLTFTELFIGFLLGFVFNLFISIFVKAGQIISMQMGLAMAIMNDPKNGAANTIIARILMISSILIFLSLDGHVLMVSIIKDSYSVWPTGQLPSNQKLELYLHLFSWLFSQALILAIPAIAIMLSSNITFGVLSKLAPSLNVFALGFPLTILMGIIALAFSLSNLSAVFFVASNDINDFLNQQFTHELK
ncbi:flagellar biosynthetic protein FliR [Vibrio sp. PNB22_3_1]